MSMAWDIFDELAGVLRADHTGLGLRWGSANLAAAGQVRLGLDGVPMYSGDGLQMVLLGFDDGGEQGQTMSDWLEKWQVVIVGYAQADGVDAPARWLAAYRLAECVRYVVRRYFLEGPGVAFEFGVEWVVSSLDIGDLHRQTTDHGHYGVFDLRLTFGVEEGT